MSKRDIIIISIVFCFGIIVRTTYDYIKDLKKPDYSIENSLLNQKIDSLRLVVFQRDQSILSRDTLIKSMKSRQLITDSLIVKNYNKSKNDKKRYESLSPDDRIKYVDSLLKSAGIRK